MLGQRLVAMMNRLTILGINNRLDIPIAFAIKSATSTQPSAESYRKTTRVFLLADRALHFLSLVPEPEIDVDPDGLTDRHFHTPGE